MSAFPTSIPFYFIWEIPRKTRVSSTLTSKLQNNFLISAVEPREMSIPRLQGIQKFVPIFYSLKLISLIILKKPFVKLSMLFMIHLTLNN